MKKLLFILQFVFIVFESSAQIKEYFKPYTSLNIGGAFSLRPLITKANLRSNVTSTPVYCIAAQQHISKRISYGIGLSYQKISSVFNNVNQGTQTYINTLYYPNLSFRYHTNAIKGLDIYLEPKLVYKYTDLKFNFKYANGNTNINTTTSIPIDRENSFNLQFCIGADLKLTKLLAINFEGALGMPYLLRLGAVFNFGNINEDNQSDKNDKPKNKKNNSDDFVNPKNRNNIYR
jgi:hypothetical protein